MKHKVKYRVVGSDRIQRKYAINLEEGAVFPLTRELFEGRRPSAGESPATLAELSVRDAALYVTQLQFQPQLRINGRPGTEEALRPGDLLEVAGFSVEFLEAPFRQDDDEHTTFLDAVEMGQHVPRKPPPADPLPLPLPSPLPLAYDLPELPDVPELSDVPELVEKPTPAPRKKTVKPPVFRRPDIPRLPTVPNPIPTPVSTPFEEESGFWGGPLLHIGISLVLSFLAAACFARVVSIRLSFDPVIIYLFAGAGAVFTAFTAFFTRLFNGFLGTQGTYRGYCRFYGWALAGSVPWAFAFQLPLIQALIALAILPGLGILAFAWAFRPRKARLAGLIGGLGVVTTCCIFGIWSAVLSHGDGLARNELPSASLQAPTPAPGDPAPSVGQASTQAAHPTIAAAPPARPELRKAAPQRPLAREGSRRPSREPAALDSHAMPRVDPDAAKEFFLAVRDGELTTVKKMIEGRTVSSNLALPDGRTALMLSVAFGRKSVGEYLISHGASVNAQDRDGGTALMWAVVRKHPECVRLLLRSGARAHLRRKAGDTALELAEQSHQGDVVKWLRQARR